MTGKKPDYRICISRGSSDKLDEVGAVWHTGKLKPHMTGSLTLEAGEAREVNLVFISTQSSEEIEKMRELAMTLAKLVFSDEPEAAVGSRKPDFSVSYDDEYLDLEGKRKRRSIKLGALWFNQKSGHFSGRAILPSSSDESRKLRVVVFRNEP